MDVRQPCPVCDAADCVTCDRDAVGEHDRDRPVADVHGTGVRRVERADRVGDLSVDLLRSGGRDRDRPGDVLERPGRARPRGGCHDPVDVGVGCLRVGHGRSRRHFTLVYDAFSGADGAPLSGHAPDINRANTPWTAFGAVGVVLRGNGAAAAAQGAAAVAGAAIDTGATDGMVGADVALADPSTTAGGYSEGLIAFRIKDANNFLVAGFGLGSFPFGLGAYNNGAMRVIQAAAVPPPVPGVRVRRVEAILDGARVVVQVDGVVVVDATTAEHADAPAHGLVWRTSEDGVSRFDLASKCPTLRHQRLLQGRPSIKGATIRGRPRPQTPMDAHD